MTRIYFTYYSGILAGEGVILNVMRKKNEGQNLKTYLKLGNI